MEFSSTSVLSKWAHCFPVLNKKYCSSVSPPTQCSSWPPEGLTFHRLRRCFKVEIISERSAAYLTVLEPSLWFQQTTRLWAVWRRADCACWQVTTLYSSKNCWTKSTHTPTTTSSSCTLFSSGCGTSRDLRLKYSIKYCTRSKFKEHLVEEGEIVYKAGDHIKELIIVEKGCLDIVFPIDGVDMVVAKLTRGSVLNYKSWSMLFEIMVCTIRCSESATLMKIRTIELDEIAKLNKQLSHKFL